MTHALFDMTPAEVVERIADGDALSVVRNIADPIERLEAERLLADQLAPESRSEALKRARHQGAYDFKVRLVEALSAIDKDLGRAVEYAIDETSLATMTAELDKALGDYVAAHIDTLLRQKAKEADAPIVEVPADITPDAPVVSLAVQQAVAAGHPTAYERGVAVGRRTKGRR